MKDQERVKPTANNDFRLVTMLIIALFVLLYIAILGVRPLFIPDEFRYGEIAREMLATGDWIVPHLNGLLYFEKPPLGHWLNAASLFLLGENPFALRLTSILAAASSALTVFVVSSRLVGRRNVSLFAAFIFLTTLEVQTVATFGTLDSMFSAALNAGIATFALGALRPPPERMWPALLAGGFFGLAFLIKGPLAFLLPVLILLPWLIVERRFAFLLKQGSMAVLVALIVIFPWSVAIYLQQPDFWRYFIWVEHFQRFAGVDPQHVRPFLFYFVFAPFAAFPWFTLIPAAIAGLRNSTKSDGERTGLRLLILWVTMPFIFFSIASGKLLTYILPCFVPLSILLALGLMSNVPQLRWQKLGLRANAFLYGGLIAVLLAAQHFDVITAQFGDDETWLLLIFIAALVLSGLIAVAGSFSNVPHRRHIAAGLSIVPMICVLVFILPRQVLFSKAPEPFLRQAAVGLPGSAIVATVGAFVRAASWSLKRDDLYVIREGGETRYGLNAPEGKGRFLESDQFGDLVARGVTENREILLVCRKECPPDYVQFLPDNTKHTSYGMFHAWRYRGPDNR